MEITPLYAQEGNDRKQQGRNNSSDSKHSLQNLHPPGPVCIATYSAQYQNKKHTHGDKCKTCNYKWHHWHFSHRHGRRCNMFKPGFVCSLQFYYLIPTLAYWAGGELAARRYHIKTTSLLAKETTDNYLSFQ